MRVAAAAFTALTLLVTAPAHAALYEFEATLSLKSVSTLFPSPPGYFGVNYGTISAGHGVASVTASGAITGFASLTGLTGVVRDGDLGTDSIIDYWEVDVGGVGSPSFTGTPLHGPMPLLLGDARRLTGSFGMTNTLAVATFLHTRNGTLGPGLGGTFASTPGPYTMLRAEFGTWTTGMLTLMSLVPPLSFSPMAPMTAGFDARTPGGLGTVQMVTPIIWEITGASPPFPLVLRRGAFGVLRIDFVPEPARGVMLASSSCLLLVLAKRRMAKTRH